MVVAAGIFRQLGRYRLLGLDSGIRRCASPSRGDFIGVVGNDQKKLRCIGGDIAWIRSVWIGHAHRVNFSAQNIGFGPQLDRHIGGIGNGAQEVFAGWVGVGKRIGMGAVQRGGRRFCQAEGAGLKVGFAVDRSIGETG